VLVIIVKLQNWKQKNTSGRDIYEDIYKRFINWRWTKNREDFTLINGTNDWHSRLGANIWTLGQYTTARTGRQVVQITVDFEYTFNRFRLEYSNLQTKYASSWTAHRSAYEINRIATEFITLWCLMQIYPDSQFEWWLLFTTTTNNIRPKTTLKLHSPKNNWTSLHNPTKIFFEKKTKDDKFPDLYAHNIMTPNTIPLIRCLIWRNIGTFERIIILISNFDCLACSRTSKILKWYFGNYRMISV